MTNCTTNYTQYPSMDSCLGSCAGFPSGNPGETTGNSRACRAYYATGANSGPPSYCARAGPTGGNVCGTLCEGFCSIVQNSCTALNQAYANLTACMGSCDVFAAGAGGYNTSATLGDTLECRVYQATVAATADGGLEAAYCPHAKSTSSTCF